MPPVSEMPPVSGLQKAKWWPTSKIQEDIRHYRRVCVCAHHTPTPRTLFPDVETLRAAIWDSPRLHTPLEAAADP